MSCLRLRQENAWRPNTVALERLVHSEQRSDDWLELRTKTIGSSEAASVFPGNISTTFTTSDLKRKLRGEPRKEPGTYLLWLFELGAAMEPVLREELAALLDATILDTGIFVCPEARMSASLDGIAVRWFGDRPRLLLTEFKFRAEAGAGWGAGRDELGKTVWCQVQHQMVVANVPAALVYVGATCGERRLWYIVQADESYFYLWRAWFDRRLQDPDTRTKKGIGDNIRAQIEGWMRQTVTQIKLSKK